VIAKSGVDPDQIDDVVFAQSYANSEAPCIGRWAALQAGLPITVPGCQVDRRCGGGLQAIINAGMMVETGAADIVLAGGVESMSNVEFYSTAMRRGSKAGSTVLFDRLERGRERSQPVERFGVISGMIETAENLARDFCISREEADEYSVESHRRAAAAWDAGKFNAEVVPVPIPGKKNDVQLFSKDEGFRSDCSTEALASLRPIIAGGTVTPGNASQQNDAAAACLIVAEDKLSTLNLEPLAFLAGWAVTGCEPATMGIGPVSAVSKLFQRAKLTWDDLDLIELNEAFAAQVLAVMKGWGFADMSRTNVNGSGISLGHPIAATGVRIMTSMLYELERQNGRRALETMCIGGGQGIAAVFERD
jgi:acetyl-CoA C-acetyltransferase